MKTSFKHTQGYRFSGVVILALVSAACGKASTTATEDKATDTAKTTTTSSTPSVEKAEGNELALAGKLTSSTAALSLAEDVSAKKILLFKLKGGGRIEGKPLEIAVEADGTFKIKIEKNSANSQKAKDAIKDDKVDKAIAKELFPDHAAEIDQMSDAELTKALKQEIAEMEKGGSYSYVLVSMVPSGDKVAEAKSMQFIGMPSAAGNLLSLPADVLKGNLNFGEIKGSGDEASSELKADKDSLNLSDELIQEFAATSNTMKALKNYWMNTTSEGKTPAEITPWFGWTSSDLATPENKFATPTDLKYEGAGFYIQVQDIGKSFGEVCPISGSGQVPLTLVPPADVTTEYGTVGPSNPFSNKGTLSRSSQYTGVACSTSNSDGGVYIRNDKPTEEGNKYYQLGWGRITSILPKGIWELKADGTTKGSYDLSAASPLDDKNNPVVYIPAFKVTTENEMMTKVEAKFFMFDKAKDAFREVTDAKALERIIHSIGIDVSYRNNSSKSDIHRSVGGGGDHGDDSAPATFVNGVVSYTLTDSEKTKYRCSGSTECLSAIGMSYLIGTTSYRMGLRAQQ